MKLLFTGIFIIVIASVYVIRQAGYNPKPLLTMKASKYDSLEIVGNGLLRRFFKEAQGIKNFYIFCEPEQCSKIQLWAHFLDQSKRNKLEGRKVLLHEILNFDYENSQSERTINFNPISLKDSMEINPRDSIIFYMVDFYVNENEETNLPTCDKSNMFTNFDCLALNYSRRFYKKKYNPSETHVGMEQISHNKFMIYLN